MINQVIKVMVGQHSGGATNAPLSGGALPLARRLALALAGSLLALGLFGPSDAGPASVSMREGSALSQPTQRPAAALRWVGAAFLAGTAACVACLLLAVRPRAGRRVVAFSLGLTALAGAAIPLLDPQANWLPFGAGSLVLLTVFWCAPLGLAWVRDEAAEEGEDGDESLEAQA